MSSLQILKVNSGILTSEITEPILISRSLLVYRDKRLCKDSTSLGENKRQSLLASAIRKAIPRILRAVIMEIVNGRATALEERIDHAIRTYLLIHQV